MVLISYDISDNKKRTRFNKYIKKFGHRLQYSLYSIENSDRILNNIISDLNNKFLKEFEEEDSVYIVKLSGTCSVKKYGYAAHEDSSILIVN